MKKLSGFLALAFLLSFVGSAYAGRPPGTPPNNQLRKVGTVATATADISGGGHKIAMIAVTCGGSACVATFADADTSALAPGDYGGDANVVIEVGAPASTTTILDLTESPISFSSGVMMTDDGNVAAATVYEFR